ncbi:MAG: hypothetical protein WEC59_11890 [Salibacteraceae bacterium]
MRFSAFIFALFYFFSSVGYGLEVHYCLGRVSDINYVLLETECPCDSLHDQMSNPNCCEERSFFNQIEDEHSAPSLVQEFGKYLPASEVLNSPFSAKKFIDTLPSETRVDRGPPKCVDRTIAYHKLTLYG